MLNASIADRSVELELTDAGVRGTTRADDVVTDSVLCTATLQLQPTQRRAAEPPQPIIRSRVVLVAIIIHDISSVAGTDRSIPYLATCRCTGAEKNLGFKKVSSF